MLARLEDFSPPLPLWSDVTPSVHPDGRYGPLLIPDLARRRAILFGGRGPAFYLNDTWALNF